MIDYLPVIIVIFTAGLACYLDRGWIKPTVQQYVKDRWNRWGKHER